MYKRYLLYIDILGFSNYVKNNPMQVKRIYKIIENLNAHRHDAFKVIVFSDTILVYNKEFAFTKDEKDYYVMFLIEFAQDLLYSFAGKKLFFRALIVEGKFEHYTDGEFEKYYGKALIRACEKEKGIKCCGLFIDAASNRNNQIFPVEKFDRECFFVYTNQSLDDLNDGMYGEIPVEGHLLESVDAQWHLAKDVAILKDIYQQMKNHPIEAVRYKMERTWEFFHKRYEKILNALVNHKFSLKALSETIDWSEAQSRITDGYKGFLGKDCTKEKIIEVVEKAKKAGYEAAEAKMDDIGREKLHFCGGTHLMLDIDGRSKIRKLFEEASSESGIFSFNYDGYRKCFYLIISGMCNYQSQIADQVASEAALRILEDELDLMGSLELYYT